MLKKEKEVRKSLFFVVVAILFFFFMLFSVGSEEGLKETGEEKALLEEELQNLTQELAELGYNLSSQETLMKEYFNISSILVENFSCNTTGYETSKVLQPGKHTLQFAYGDCWLDKSLVGQVDKAGPGCIIAYAYNQVEENTTIIFDRDLECHKCGKHKAPPLTNVNMSISATVSSAISNASLIDYYPNEWTVTNANEGVISNYNSTYSKISWNIGFVNTSVVQSYIIKSPQRTTPSTKYYFQSELTNQITNWKSDWWMVIVADPSSYEFHSNALTQGAADSTGGTLSNLYLNDDTTYDLISTGMIMEIDTWNTTTGDIVNVSLFIRYKTDTGYGATDYIRWAFEDGTYANTGIAIIDTAGVEVKDIWYFPSTVDTWNEIENLNITLTDNDPGGNDDVYIDVLWINVTYTAPDTELPNIQLVAPANNTLNTTDDTPDFTFNVTDETATSLNCTLWLDNATAFPAGQNSSTANATNTIITSNTTLANDDYWWWINCSDGTNTNISIKYNISINIPFGWLNVSLQFPTDNTEVVQNTTFDINATITCSGATGAKCGAITALARYNWTSALPDTGINTTTGDRPLFIAGGGSNYSKCMDITITNAGTSTLTNFPAYINLTKDDDMLSDYKDLRFYNASCNNGGVLLDYEIENYTSTNAHIWTRIPSLPSTGKVISVYYKNNTVVSSGENPTGVWDSNYVMVQHLQESCATANCTKDSTQYNNNGTPYSGGAITNLYNESGKIDGAYDFNGSSDRVKIPYSSSLAPENITVGLWVFDKEKNNSWDDANGIIAGPGEGYSAGWRLIDDNFTNLQVNFGGDAPKSIYNESYGLEDDKWHFLAWTYNSTHVYSYFDSELIKTYFNDSGINWGTSDLWMGYAQWYFNGTIDEVRISNISRSADWINQTYQMIANQSSFVTFGAEEGVNLQTSLETLEQGESWLVNWTVNATGAINSSYEIDVNFSSSYGNANVPTNNTDNHTIIITGLAVANPVVSNTAVNTTSVNTSYANPGYVCINSTVTDPQGSDDINTTWITVTYPNSTVSNITTTNDTSTVWCVGGSVYGTNLFVGYDNGTLTINTSWANDTSNNIGSENPLLNVSVNAFGWLNVSLQFPTDNTNVIANTTFDVNATIICAGGTNAKCGTVEALARYNWTSALPDTGINTTTGDIPLFIAGGGSNYSRCRDITITNAGTTTLTDFPAYINLTKDDDMLSDYKDLRFYNASCNNGGVLLNYEIENYTTTKADIWVRIPSLPSTNKTISVYYKNNTPVSSGENPTGVWDSNYKGVWHLQETGTGTRYDSTSYGNNGTTSGYDGDEAVTGKIDGADDFDGVDDSIDCGNSSVFNPTQELTVEVWVKMAKATGAGEWPNFVKKGNGEQNYYIYQDSNGARLAAYIKTTSGEDWGLFTANQNVSLDTWYYLVLTYDSITGDIKAYRDGVLNTTEPHSGTLITTTDNLTINTGAFNGSIDEVRISNTNRSADWINQSYQMVTNQTSFVSFGDEEGVNPQTSPETLEQGESWLVNWTVNATGSIGSEYEIDVNFSSSYGNALVQTNNTDNHTIKITAELIVTLNLPVNNNNTINFTNINFNCSATGSNLANITLYTNYNDSWKAIANKSLTGNDNSTLFNRNILADIGVNGSKFIDTSFKWNCLAYDSASLNDWGDSNFTFSSWDLGTYNYTKTDNENLTLDDNDTIQELPSDQADDWANMTGNVLLMHFNNDSSVGENYNNSNGSIIYDYSGLGNNGTLYVGDDNSGNYSPTGGKLNGAFEFDGSDDYIEITSSSELEPAQNITVAAWFKTNTLSPSIAVIVAMTNANNGAGKPYSIEQLTNEVRFGIRNSSGGQNVDYPISQDVWYHAVGTYDGAQAKLYVNGVESSTSATGDIDYTWSDFIGIGRKNKNDAEYFNGTIDEVAVYNRTLSAVEILDIYNNQKSRYFTEGIGTYTSQIFDASSTVSWDNLSWSESPCCMQKELPNNQYDEKQDYSDGANMTGNVLLMHFNNDTSVGENYNNTLNQNTTVYDYSSNGNNGTVITNSTNAGPTYSATGGKFNGSFEFDGNDDYVLVDDTASLDIIDNLTIEAWAKFSNVDGSVQAILGKCEDYASFTLRLNANSVGERKISVKVEGGDTEKRFTTTTVTQVQNNVWYYVVGVKEGNASLKIYLNGVLENTTTNNISMATNSYNLFIGGDPKGTAPGILDYPFNGTIDEFAIYNRSLSATEILNHYKRGVLRLNISVHDCNDPACSGEENTWDLTCTNSSYCNLSSVSGSRYFQYKANFDTDDGNFTPYILGDSVNISYTIGGIQAPVVTLNLPVNNNNSVDFTDVTFNCSATNDANLANISLYTNYNGSWSLIENKSLTGISNSTTFSRNILADIGINGSKFIDSSFKWNCLAYDAAGLSDWGDSNFTFSSWSLGSYNETKTDNVNVTLDDNDTLQELLGDRAIDWANMTGNVLLMHFNNNSAYGENNSLMYDFSSNGNNGTCSGTSCPTWNSSGKLNGAFEFDGDDDYINCGSDNSFNITDELTIEAWIKTNSAAEMTIYTRESQMWFYVDDKKLMMQSWVDWSGIYGTDNISSDWNHVAFVWNKDSSPKGIIYLNGESYVSGSPTNFNSGSGNIVTIGCDETPAKFFNGTIDEVAIWNRSLSADEIKEIYNNQRNKYFTEGIGTYTSQVFDGASTVSWDNLSWTESPCCMNKELPNDQSDEKQDYSDGANMSKNVLLFHFNNNSAYGENDTLVYDFSGYGNNGTAYVNNSDGTIRGPNATGKFNGAFEFDGEDDYISFSTDGGSSLRIEETVTVAVWIKPAHSLASHQQVIDAHWGTQGIPAYGITQAQNDDSTCPDKWIFEVYYNTTPGYYNKTCTSDSTATVDVNKWQHVVGTYDKTAGKVKVYKNGVLGATVNFNKNMTTGNAIFYIGRISYGRYFNGTIDEVAVWNRSLSATEILNHYKRGALRLNISVHDCNDVACSGEENTWDQTCTNSSYCDLSSVTSSRYFQYKASFDTDDGNYTPYILGDSVNISYTPGGIQPPVVTLNRPVNNNNSIDFTNVTFNCSATNDASLTNITLYTDYNGTWQAIENQSLTGADNSTLFNRNILADIGVSGSKFIDSSFKWNCLAYDAAGLSDWGDSNFTFSSWSLGTYNYTKTDNVNLTLDDNDTIQELPSDRVEGWANMSKNVLLMHFSNDTMVGENYNNSNGSIIYDYSGIGNNGTLYVGADNSGNYSPTGGILGGAFTFDGVDDYIDCGNDSSLNITDAITISAWVRPINKTRDFTSIVSKGGYDNSFSFYSDDGRVGATWLIDGSRQPTDGYWSDVFVDFNKWNHIVYTHNANTGAWRIYKNGILGHSETSATGTFDTDNSPLLIGKEDSENCHVYGTIDEVAIWNRSLSAAEIKEIYDNQKGKYFSEGDYLSQVFDASSTVSWDNLSWSEPVPYEEELPNGQEDELSAGVLGGANMSKNVLLMHFNNDTAVGENYNNSEGYTVYDYSGIGNNGTAYANGTAETGPQFTTAGKFNGALEFDGQDDYIEVASDTSFDITDELTIEAWVKTGSADTMAIYNRWSQMWFYVSDKKLRMQSHVDWSGIYGTENIPSDWNHVAFVWNKDSTPKGIIYLNGKSYATGSPTNFNSGSGNAVDVFCGDDSGNKVQFFNGTTDEFAIFNRTLSASEILDIYKRGALRLNISVHDCNDPACSGEENTWDQTCTNSSFCNLSSVSGSKYFQYKANFDTDDGNYTPYILGDSVNISYTPPVDTTPPNVTAVSDSPDPQGFGENVTIQANVTDDTAVDTVLVEITDPNSVKINYTMTNTSYSVFNYTYLNWTNGTYNYRIYANDTYGNKNTTETGTFDLFVNLTVQVKTLKDSYGANEFVNLTDPPSLDLSDFGISNSIDSFNDIKESENKNNLDNKIESRENYKLSSLIRSFVLNTLTLDCCLNALSPDQIAQSNLSARAKYGTSLSCGEISLASDSLSEKSFEGMNWMLSSNKPTNTLKSVSEKPDFCLISSLFLSSSLSNSLGANILTFSENSISSFLVGLSLPFAIIEENNSLASITSFIYNNLGYCFLNSLNIPSLTLLANSLASFSVNLDLATNVSNTALCKVFDLESCRANALAINASLTTSIQSTSEFSSISCFNSSGKGTLNSSILKSPDRESKNNYLKLSEYDNKEETINEKITKPLILNASVKPVKVQPGDLMLVSAFIKDNYGIKEVKADMGGIEVIDLECSEIREEKLEISANSSTHKPRFWEELGLEIGLDSGKNFYSDFFKILGFSSSNGKFADVGSRFWERGELYDCSTLWRVHDTEIKDYITTITATNILGKSSFAYVEWSDPSWANTTFSRCKNITITNAGTSTLTNFPAYINLTKDDDMLSNYSDLRFYNVSCNNGGTLLDYEIENYTDTNAHIWVRIPSLPSTGKVISVYYKNNTPVSSGENPTGVWDSNYRGVWHMTEVNATDSTSNNNDGNESGGVTFNSTGKIDGAIDFDGVDDCINTSHSSSLNITDKITVGMWVKKLGNPPTWHRILQKGNDLWYFWISSSGGVSFKVKNTTDDYSDCAGFSLSDSAWDYLTGMYNGTHVIFYLNGEFKTSCPLGGNIATDSGSLAIGNNPSGTSPFNGTIDEVRVYNGTLSADWINQTYQLVANQSSFVSFGDEQGQPGTWWDSTYDRCKNITISNAGSTTLTNFPAYINLTYDNDMLSDYKDLRFIDNYCKNGGSELDFEIENYTTSKADIWVRIPSLPSTNKIISVYYKNNTVVSSGENPTGVWDSNYVGVWHLDETPSNGGTHNDSTSNDNNGTFTDANGDSNTNVEGKIDGADNFSGVGDDDNVDVGDIADALGQMTVSAWVKTGTVTGGGADRRDIVSKEGASAGWILRINTATDVFEFYANDDQDTDWEYAVSSTTVQTGQWYYVVGVYNKNAAASRVKIFINGSLDGTGSADAVDIETTPYAVWIGANPQYSGRDWNGTIDEVRISTTNRSADWINQSYQMVANQGSYVSFGAEEIPEEDQSKIKNQGPTNTSVYILMKVQFYQNSTDTWIDDGIVVNDTTPRRINASSQLKLDELFNGKWNTSANASNGDGTYRVYVAVTDPDDNVLQNHSGANLTATYNFTITGLVVAQYYLQNISESVTLTLAIGRLGNFFRLKISTLTITDLIIRSTTLFRPILHSINILDFIYKLPNFIKIITQTLNINDFISRLVLFYRSILESINITDLLAKFKEFAAKIITETLNITDFISRLAIFGRAITESFNITDFIARLATWYRSILEILNINDFITRIQGFVKLLSETLNINDFIDRLGIFYRSIVESFNIIDLLAKFKEFAAKIITETLNITDFISRLGVFGRATLESLNITDFIARLATWYRSITEILNINDFITRIQGFIKLISETLNITDFIDRLGKFFRATTEFINITDLLAKFKEVAAKTITETLNINDFITRLAIFGRSILQGININDFITRLANLYRAILESLNISDFIYKLPNFIKIITQSLNINDFISRLASFGRSITETFSFVEKIYYLAISRLTRLITETLNINDFITRTLSLFRLTLESLNIVDLLAKLRAIPKVILETLNINDFISRLAVGYRSILESFNINDFITRLQGFVKIITQTLNINDFISRLAIFYRSITEYINITDLLYKFKEVAAKTITETLNINDFINRLATFGRTVLQGINISDFVSRLVNWYRSITEILNISDFIYKLPNFIKIITQTLNINDFIDRLAIFYRSITEQINITDLLARFKEVALKTITETLNITDFIDRLALFGRAVIQGINISDFVSRLVNWYKSIIETLNIKDFITRLPNFVKLITETLNINDFISRLSIFVRTITQSLNISDFISRFRSFFRTILEMFSFLFGIVKQADLYLLDLKDPTQASPQTVSDGENITITFNLTKFDNPVIENVTVLNVSIGGEECSILSGTGGGESTTVQLQDADTENLDDTFVDNSAGEEDDEFGASKSMKICVESDDDMYGYIKFNISAIPSGQQIDDATLYLYLTVEYIDVGESMDVGVRHVYSFPTYNISDEEWIEGNDTSAFGEIATAPEISWNTKPGVGEMNATVEDFNSYNSSPGTGWYDWSVVNMVTKSYNDGDNNISIEIYPYNEVSLEATDNLFFATKEYTLDTTRRPYLNITYSEVAAGEQTWYDDSAELWNTNCTVPSGLIGYQDLYTQANYTTDSTERSDTETNAIRYKGIYTRFITFTISITDRIIRSQALFRLQTQTFQILRYVLRNFNSVREFLQIFNLSDFISKLPNFVKLITQNININDFISRLATFSRSILESFNIVDLLVRFKEVAAKTITETLNINDFIARLVTWYRSTLESLNINDFITRLSNVFRTILESLNINDFIIRLQGFVKLATQRININDFISRLALFYRSVLESFNITDLLAKFKGFATKTILETLNINDFIARLSTLSRIILQSLNITDFVSRLSILSRTILESFNVTDFIARLSSFFRTITESLSFLEYILKSYVSGITKTIKNITESFSIVDLVSKFKGISKAILESFNINEFIDRLSILFRIILQSVNINEFIDRLSALSRMIAESLNLTDFIVKIQGFFKLVSETLNISDFIDRLAIFYRDIIEYISITDLLAKFKEVALKTVTETLNITDFISRLALFGRSILQSININDFISRLATLYRSILETLNINDFISRLRVVFRLVTETLNITDLISRLSIFGRTVLQSFNITDFVSRLSALSRTILESFNITDFIIRLQGFFKAITQTLNINDFISRLAIFYRSIIEYINITDLLAKFKEVAAKIITETLNINDFISRLAIFGRSIVQGLNINDFIVRLATWYRSVLESINIVDFITKLQGLFRLVTETLNINDFIDRLAVFYRTILESFNIADLVAKFKAIAVKTITETLNINDFISRLAVFYRTILESFNITDLLARFKEVALKAITETLNITDFISRLSMFGRTILQGLNINDFIARSSNLFRTILQSLNITDFITRLQSFFKLVTQTLNVNDFVSRLATFSRTILQSLNITDLISRLSAFFRAITETFNIADFIAWLKTTPIILRTITESINIADFVTRLQNSFRILTQTLNISDLIGRLQNLFRTILQSLNITDFITKLRSISKRIFESFSIKDLSERLQSVVRVIVETINLNDLISRLSSFFRTFLERFNIFDFISWLRTIFAPIIAPGLGGGGPTAVLIRKSFDVTPDLIKAELKVGESTIEELKIENTGDVKLKFKLETDLELIYISESEFDLAVGETKIIILGITAPDEPGIYTGHISVKANGLLQKIPIIVEVETRMILFDVKLDLPWRYKKIYVGEDLKAQITLFEMGENPKVDVILHYLIKDLNNNIMREESETLAVDQQLSFTKTFYTQDLPADTYVIAIEARYDTSFAVSSDTFKIVEKKLPLPIEGKIFTVLLAIVTTLIIIYFFIKEKEKLKQGKRKKIKKFQIRKI